MSNFPKISYSDGGVHVTVDLRALDQRMREAQQWLGDRVLEDCKACMPLLTGSLQQRSYTEDDGKKVVFPGPYARYQYGGKAPAKSLQAPVNTSCVSARAQSSLPPTGR